MHGGFTTRADPIPRRTISKSRERSQPVTSSLLGVSPCAAPVHASQTTATTRVHDDGAGNRLQACASSHVTNTVGCSRVETTSPSGSSTGGLDAVCGGAGGCATSVGCRAVTSAMRCSDSRRGAGSSSRLTS